MTRDEALGRLGDIIRDYFDDDSIVVTADTTADDVEDWDSLEHVGLIVEVEHEFGVKFNVGEANAMRNVGEMADLILEKLA